LRVLHADPMTSGGLLIGAAAERAGEMEDALRRTAPAEVEIGSLEIGERGAIAVEWPHRSIGRFGTR
jgi:selenophosphate synthase